MQPKVIFVDWDGTLSDSRFWEGCNTPNLSPRIIAGVTMFLFRDSKDLITRWMTGFTSSSRVVGIAANRFGLNAQELHEELERSCRNMRLVNSTIPAKIKKIQEQGTRVMIATDNMDTFENWTVPSLGLDRVFDGILSSPSRGALKSELHGSESPFFDLYFKQQGINPSESILIDNSLNNKKLERTGMQFVHINGENTLSQILDTFI
jgi:FMN phosphatase YigB (HAD superfamily)